MRFGENSINLWLPFYRLNGLFAQKNINFWNYHNDLMWCFGKFKKNLICRECSTKVWIMRFGENSINLWLPFYRLNSLFAQKNINFRNDHNDLMWCFGKFKKILICRYWCTKVWIMRFEENSINLWLPFYRQNVLFAQKNIKNQNEQN